MRLGRIAIPSWHSKGALLLVSQFFLLIMRTLLTVTAVKTNMYFLTKVRGSLLQPTHPPTLVAPFLPARVFPRVEASFMLLCSFVRLH